MQQSKSLPAAAVVVCSFVILLLSTLAHCDTTLRGNGFIHSSWSQQGLDEFHTNLAAYMVQHNSWLTGNWSHTLYNDVVIDSFNGYMIGESFDTSSQLILVSLSSGSIISFQSSGFGLGQIVSPKVVDNLGNVYFISKSSRKQLLTMNRFNANGMTLKQVDLPAGIPYHSQITSMILTATFKIIISVDDQSIYSIGADNLNIHWGIPFKISSNLLLRQGTEWLYFLSGNSLIEMDVSQQGRVLGAYQFTNNPSVSYGKITYLDNFWFSIVYNKNLLTFYSTLNKYIVKESQLAGEFESCSGIGYSTVERVRYLSYCYELGQNSPFSIYQLNTTQNSASFSKSLELTSPNFQTTLAAVDDTRSFIVIGLKDSIQIVNVQNGQVVKQLPRESGTSVKLFVGANGMLYLLGYNNQLRKTTFQSIKL